MTHSNPSPASSLKEARTSPRRWAGRFLLVAASLLLATFLAELLFRAFGPPDYKPPVFCSVEGNTLAPVSDIIIFLQNAASEKEERPGSNVPANIHVKGWYDRPQWDYFGEDDTVDYKTNAFGFRDNAFPLEKKEGELRILAVGDSFTFGLGVQQEHCWTEVLEGKLEEHWRGPVEVINAGFACGSMPYRYWHWILNKGLVFDPHMVIIGFCLNDMGKVPLRAISAKKPIPLLGGYSKIVNHLQKYLMRRRASEKVKKAIVENVKTFPRQWIENQKAIRSIKKSLAEKEIRLVVAILPMLSCLQGENPYAELHRMVREFCQKEGIEWVDLLDRFLGKDERDLWVHPTDPHPNHQGHRLIAEGIFDYLVSRL